MTPLHRRSQRRIGEPANKPTGATLKHLSSLQLPPVQSQPPHPALPALSSTASVWLCPLFRLPPLDYEHAAGAYPGHALPRPGFGCGGSPINSDLEFSDVIC